MSSDENNKEEKTGGVTRDTEDCSAKLGSFAQYVRSVHELEQKGTPEGRFAEIFQTARIRDILEYAKLKNEAGAVSEKFNPLISALPYVPVSFAKDSNTYECLELNVQPKTFHLKKDKIAEQKVNIYINDRSSSVNEIEFFSNDFAHAILDNLEKQVIGDPEEKDEDGMLGQKWLVELQGDFVEICLEAIDKFYERASGFPSAIVMSFREKTALVKSLSKRDAAVLATPCASFAGIPIIISKHVPDRKIILAKLEGVHLVGDDDKSTFKFGAKGCQREVTYTYFYGVVIRDTRSAMTVFRKDCDE